jgi:hypothetical protein
LTATGNKPKYWKNGYFTGTITCSKLNPYDKDSYLGSDTRPWRGIYCDGFKQDVDWSDLRLKNSIEVFDERYDGLFD